MADRRAQQPVLLCGEFGRADVSRIRREVGRHAAGAGLAGPRLDDFVLAVNEIVTNAAQYAPDGGRLRLWVAAGEVCCEVSDRGGGIPADRVAAALPPATSSPGGRGIFLARRLCDRLTVATGPGGTTIRVVTALDQESSGELFTASA